jgi:hypothetical protein
MTDSEMHHDVNRELLVAARLQLSCPSQISVSKVELTYDHLSVPRNHIEAMAAALDLADRKITQLENISRGLAGVLRDILRLAPPDIHGNPTIARGFAVLDKLEATLK